MTVFGLEGNKKTNSFWVLMRASLGILLSAYTILCAYYIAPYFHYIWTFDWKNYCLYYSKIELLKDDAGTLSLIHKVHQSPPKFCNGAQNTSAQYGVILE